MASPCLRHNRVMLIQLFILFFLQNFSLPYHIFFFYNVIPCVEGFTDLILSLPYTIDALDFPMRPCVVLSVARKCTLVVRLYLVYIYFNHFVKFILGSNSVNCDISFFLAFVVNKSLVFC